VTWEDHFQARIDTTLRPIFDRELASARGHRLGLSSDRLVASFDGPGRAVRCGTTLIDAAVQSGVAARGGLHIGERMLTDDSDPVVQFSADMADAAGPGQLYVSRTVADLLPGSGLRFEHRGQLAMPVTGNAIAVLAVVG
jgi:class 3 adenylate cyclase